MIRWLKKKDKHRSNSSSGAEDVDKDDYGFAEEKPRDVTNLYTSGAASHVSYTYTGGAHFLSSGPPVTANPVKPASKSPTTKRDLPPSGVTKSPPPRRDTHHTSAVSGPKSPTARRELPPTPAAPEEKSPHIYEEITDIGDVGNEKCSSVKHRQGQGQLKGELGDNISPYMVVPVDHDQRQTPTNFYRNGTPEVHCDVIVKDTHCEILLSRKPKVSAFKLDTSATSQGLDNSGARGTGAGGAGGVVIRNNTHFCSRDRRASSDILGHMTSSSSDVSRDLHAGRVSNSAFSVTSERATSSSTSRVTSTSLSNLSSAQMTSQNVTHEESQESSAGGVVTYTAASNFIPRATKLTFHPLDLDQFTASYEDDGEVESMNGVPMDDSIGGADIAGNYSAIQDHTRVPETHPPHYADAVPPITYAAVQEQAGQEAGSVCYASLLNVDSSNTPQETKHTENPKLHMTTVPAAQPSSCFYQFSEQHLATSDHASSVNSISLRPKSPSSSSTCTYASINVPDEPKLYSTISEVVQPSHDAPKRDQVARNNQAFSRDITSPHHFPGQSDSRVIYSDIDPRLTDKTCPRDVNRYPSYASSGRASADLYPKGTPSYPQEFRAFNHQKANYSGQPNLNNSASNFETGTFQSTHSIQSQPGSSVEIPSSAHELWRSENRTMANTINSNNTLRHANPVNKNGLHLDFCSCSDDQQSSSCGCADGKNSSDDVMSVLGGPSGTGGITDSCKGACDGCGRLIRQITYSESMSDETYEHVYSSRLLTRRRFSSPDITWSETASDVGGGDTWREAVVGSRSRDDTWVASRRRDDVTKSPSSMEYGETGLGYCPCGGSAESIMTSKYDRKLADLGLDSPRGLAAAPLSKLLRRQNTSPVSSESSSLSGPIPGIRLRSRVLSPHGMTSPSHSTLTPGEQTNSDVSQTAELADEKPHSIGSVDVPNIQVKRPGHESKPTGLSGLLSKFPWGKSKPAKNNHSINSQDQLQQPSPSLAQTQPLPYSPPQKRQQPPVPPPNAVLSRDSVTQPPAKNFQNSTLVPGNCDTELDIPEENTKRLSKMFQRMSVKESADVITDTDPSADKDMRSSAFQVHRALQDVSCPADKPKESRPSLQTEWLQELQVKLTSIDDDTKLASAPPRGGSAISGKDAISQDDAASSRHIPPAGNSSISNATTNVPSKPADKLAKPTTGGHKTDSGDTCYEYDISTSSEGEQAGYDQVMGKVGKTLNLEQEFQQHIAELNLARKRLLCKKCRRDGTSATKEEESSLMSEDTTCPPFNNKFGDISAIFGDLVVDQRAAILDCLTDFAHSPYNVRCQGHESHCRECGGDIVTSDSESMTTVYSMMSQQRLMTSAGGQHTPSVDSDEGTMADNSDESGDDTAKGCHQQHMDSNNNVDGNSRSSNNSQSSSKTSNHANDSSGYDEAGYSGTEHQASSSRGKRKEKPRDKKEKRGHNWFLGHRDPDSMSAEHRDLPQVTSTTNVTSNSTQASGGTTKSTDDVGSQKDSDNTKATSIRRDDDKREVRGWSRGSTNHAVSEKVLHDIYSPLPGKAMTSLLTGPCYSSHSTPCSCARHRQGMEAGKAVLECGKVQATTVPSPSTTKKTSLTTPQSPQLQSRTDLAAPQSKIDKDHATTHSEPGQNYAEASAESNIAGGMNSGGSSLSWKMPPKPSSGPQSDCSDIEKSVYSQDTLSDEAKAKAKAAKILSTTLKSKVNVTSIVRATPVPNVKMRRHKIQLADLDLLPETALGGDDAEVDAASTDKGNDSTKKEEKNISEEADPPTLNTTPTETNEGTAIPKINVPSDSTLHSKSHPVRRTKSTLVGKMAQMFENNTVSNTQLSTKSGGAKSKSPVMITHLSNPESKSTSNVHSLSASANSPSHTPSKTHVSGASKPSPYVVKRKLAGSPSSILAKDSRHCSSETKSKAPSSKHSTSGSHEKTLISTQYRPKHRSSGTSEKSNSPSDMATKARSRSRSSRDKTASGSSSKHGGLKLRGQGRSGEGQGQDGRDEKQHSPAPSSSSSSSSKKSRSSRHRRPGVKRSYHKRRSSQKGERSGVSTSRGSRSQTKTCYYLSSDLSDIDVQEVDDWETYARSVTSDSKVKTQRSSRHGRRASDPARQSQQRDQSKTGDCVALSSSESTMTSHNVTSQNESETECQQEVYALPPSSADLRHRASAASGGQEAAKPKKNKRTDVYRTKKCNNKLLSDIIMRNNDMQIFGHV